MFKRFPAKWVITLMVAVSLHSFAEQRKPPQAFIEKMASHKWGENRTITQVSDHVYMWGSDDQNGAYIATKDGILVVDGHHCPSGTVPWLKNELSRRYEAPIKYLVLSHDHPDHICNSDVLGEGAVTVSHSKLRDNLLAYQRKAAIPDVTFDENLTLHLGDLEVNLIYLGPTHSNNLIQVHIPKEKVLIAIDFAKGKKPFPDLRDMDIDNSIRALKTLADMADVENVIPGHGPVTTQEGFLQSRDYLKALRDEVRSLMVEGKNLKEIRNQVTMENFSDYENIGIVLDWNIVTMYDYLYRQLEPNNPTTPWEAADCIEFGVQCRTNDRMASH